MDLRTVNTMGQYERWKARTKIPQQQENKKYIYLYSLDGPMCLKQPCKYIIKTKVCS
jgi:hypothetical protein